MEAKVEETTQIALLYNGGLPEHCCFYRMFVLTHHEAMLGNTERKIVQGLRS